MWLSSSLVSPLLKSLKEKTLIKNLLSLKCTCMHFCYSGCYKWRWKWFRNTLAVIQHPPIPFPHFSVLCPGSSILLGEGSQVSRSPPSREQALEWWVASGSLSPGNLSPNKVSPFAELQNETAQSEDLSSQDKGSQLASLLTIIC